MLSCAAANNLACPEKKIHRIILVETGEHDGITLENTEISKMTGGKHEGLGADDFGLFGHDCGKHRVRFR